MSEQTATRGHGTAAEIRAAPLEARTAPEADVVGRWQTLVNHRGRLDGEQPMVCARAIAP